jgi:hypothetical protein
MPGRGSTARWCEIRELIIYHTSAAIQEEKLREEKKATEYDTPCRILLEYTTPRFFMHQFLDWCRDCTCSLCSPLVSAILPWILREGSNYCVSMQELDEIIRKTAMNLCWSATYNASIVLLVLSVSTYTLSSFSNDKI